MVKALFLLCVLFFSRECIATSCFTSDEGVSDSSKSAQDEFKIDVRKESYSVDVTIFFPKEIEGLSFSGITLFKKSDSDERTEILVPLSVTNENGRLISWYVVGSDLSDNNVVEAVYGDPCGLVVRYLMDYEEEKVYPEPTPTMSSPE